MNGGYGHTVIELRQRNLTLHDHTLCHTVIMAEHMPRLNEHSLVAQHQIQNVLTIGLTVFPAEVRRLPA